MAWSREQYNTWKREWRQRNLERLRAQARALYWKDPEKYREKSKRSMAKRHAENPEHIRALGRRWRRRHAQELNARGRDAKFGLAPGQYAEMLSAQGGVCAICKQAETMYDRRKNAVRELAVDHDHRTGDVRGLLCARCNQIIGRGDDDTSLLLAAAMYLMRIDGQIQGGAR